MAPVSPAGVVAAGEEPVGEEVPSSSHTLRIVEQLGFPSCVGEEMERGREGQREGQREGVEGGTEGQREGWREGWRKGWREERR